MIDFREDIQAALDVLYSGGIILYPTDTIWGIGCDAANTDAVKRIYDLKKREDSKSMLILLENPNRITGYVDGMPDVAWDLIEFAEKPTTIIFDSAKNVANNLIPDDGTIGVRITKEAFSQNLIQRFKKPIVSTSANISGMPSPQNFSEISEEIKANVDYVVKYRQEETKNPAPSSIIKLGATGEIQIIRK